MKFRLTDSTLGIIALQLLFLLFAACAQENKTTQDQAYRNVFSSALEPSFTAVQRRASEPDMETVRQTEARQIAVTAPVSAAGRRHRVKHYAAPPARTQVYGQIYRVPMLDE